MAPDDRPTRATRRLRAQLPNGSDARTLALWHGLFVVVPLIVTAGLILIFAGGDAHLFASDFQRSYWPAAQSILRGNSPYVAPRLLDLTRDVGFAYPAVGALAVTPLGVLPPLAGGAIFTLLNLLALPLSLYLLGVRDVRVYGITFLWLPTIAAWETANVSLLLVLLGISLAWRYRDRPYISGVTIALLISIKPITWPLILWLLGSRRRRALAWSVGTGLVLNLLAWTTLGWGEVARFTALMEAFAHQGARIGFTGVTLLLHLGVADGAAYVLGLSLGAAACSATFITALRGHERTAMVACVAAILFATSIVWLHYFVLLIVPLALVRPRLSALWAVPLLMWVCLPTDNPATWQIAVALAAALTVCALSLRPARTREHAILVPAPAPA